MAHATAQAILRFRQVLRVGAWPQWSAAEAKLREVGCTTDQLRAIRRGVQAVIMDGSTGTKDPDVAWHISQVISVLLHEGFEILTVLERPGVRPNIFRSPFDGAWVVDVR